MKAAVVKAQLLGKLNLFDQEMVLYENIIGTFDLEECADSQWYIRMMKRNIFRHFTMLVDSEAKLRILDLFIDKYSLSENPHMHFCVVNALYAKGKLLSEQNKIDEAIKAYEKIDLYENFDYRYLTGCIAKSWLDRGILYKKNDKISESNHAFKQVIEGYSNVRWSVLREIVEDAIVAKGLPFPIEIRVEAYLEEILKQTPHVNPDTDIRLEEIVKELGLIIMGVKREETEKEFIIAKIIDSGIGNSYQFRPLQVLYIEAIFKKADILCFSEKNDFAQKLYDELEAKFDHVEDHELQDMIIESFEKKVALLPSEASNEIADINYKLAQKYAQKGEKEHCRVNIENALDYGIPVYMIRENSLFKELFKDDPYFQEMLEKYSQLEQDISDIESPDSEIDATEG